MSDEQLSLVPGRTKRAKAEVPMAQVDPIAHVVIDTPLPHLDRIFDYAIPAKMSDDIQQGVRVRVRFAGKLTDAFVVGRSSHTDHDGALLAIASVVSAEPVLTPEVLQLCRSVAARWAGTLSDVLRNAVPNRHARAEAATDLTSDEEIPAPNTQSWTPYVGSSAFITRSCDGQSPRAIVTTGIDDSALMIAEYVLALAHSSKSSIVVVPDRHAVEQIESALRELGAPSWIMTSVMADDGPEKRYRNWLRALRGSARIAIGTRSAVFAPVDDLAAIVVWDDWNASLYDPQAPYWNARDVAVLRSQQQETALLIIGSSVSTDAVALMPWLAHVARSKESARENWPKVRSAYDDTYKDTVGKPVRIPPLAFHVTQKALQRGPVLFLTSRAGYMPRLACDTCRTLAVCSSCAGPLMTTRLSSVPTCYYCGHQDGSWKCSRCNGTSLRANQVGSERTAEELGRAFPGIPVRSSSGDRILRTIQPQPSIIVATPGAVPEVEGGYAAAIILDGNGMLARPDLRASEDAFTKWMETAAHVRADGEVVIVADSDLPAVQGIIRNDPIGFAGRENSSRAEVMLPPEYRLIALTGNQSDIDDLLEIVQQSVAISPTHIRGPVPLAQGQIRYLVTATKADAPALIAAVKAATAVRSAKHKGSPVNVKVDPRDI